MRRGLDPTLLVVTDSFNGGLGAAAIQHAEWFRSRGWQVTLAGPGSAPESDVDVRTVPIPPSATDVSQMLRAAEVVRAIGRQANVVHCHGERSFVVACLAGFRGYVTQHGFGSLATQGKPYALLRRVALAITPLVARAAFSAEPDFLRGWRFLPHASPALARLELRPFPEETPPLFVWCGRLAEPKLPELFIQAIATLARDAAVEGLMVGDGPLRSECDELIRETGAPVRMVGWSDCPERYVERGWALVSLSHFEALTFAVQEAMWMGRPIVTTRLPGPVYLVGDAGVVVENSVARVVTGLRMLLDRERAIELGDKAAARIRGLIRVDDPWARLESEYSSRVRSGAC